MLKVLELFGGIGACSKALERFGVDFEIADYVEIDKYAVASFNAIHGTSFEPQDICEWNKDIDVDLIMHGSPCQDFSVAGNQAGGDFGSGTRSSLMYETIRIVEKLKPRYVIWENVKNLLSNKHRHNFDAYLETMSELGYKSYYQVLNAKDYGIPQNRERVFTISIKNDINKVFEFPPKQELELRLKDILEFNVDDKYYLNYPLIIKKNCSCDLKHIGNIPKEALNDNERQRRVFDTTGISPTILGRSDSPKIVSVGLLDIKGSQQVKRVYSTNGIAPTIDTMQGGHRQPKVLIQSKTIRKLTPKECWRLMGFDDSDFEKAEKVNSNTQLYKQAGNSIVVSVLENILKILLKNDKK